MSLPNPPSQYSLQDQAQTRSQLNMMDRQNWKRGQDIDLRTSRLIAQSPDGNLWVMGVSNAGTTTWTAL